MENPKLETPIQDLEVEEWDGIADELGYVANRRLDLMQVPPVIEASDTPPAPEELSRRERLVLSFNRHPVLETALGSAALTSLGFALGGAVFSHRRRTLRTA